MYYTLLINPSLDFGLCLFVRLSVRLSVRHGRVTLPLHTFRYLYFFVTSWDHPQSYWGMYDIATVNNVSNVL